MLTIQDEAGKDLFVIKDYETEPTQIKKAEEAKKDEESKEGEEVDAK